VQWGLLAALGAPRGTRSNMLETRNMRKNSVIPRGGSLNLRLHPVEGP